MNEKPKIKVTKDGPYEVSGNVPLDEERIVDDAEGFPLKWERKKEYSAGAEYRLCRCGLSQNKPFCDQSHDGGGINCEETASNVPFERQAETIDGPELTLKDAPLFCVHAGFCDRAGGIWDLTEKSDSPKAKQTAIEEAANCPSGRLLELDKSQKAIEPDFTPSISATEDEDNVAGPLWVKGGIPVESAEGRVYETRNRVTLCQCGRSKNKPFCDGSHNHLEENQIDPIRDLIVEHGLIRLMLQVLEKMHDTNNLSDVLAFLSEFADKCHHGKEEDCLFPMMKQNGPPRIKELIENLLKEHQEARGYVQGLALDFKENSQKYIALLDQHIIKENKILFPEARQALSSKQVEELEKGFEDIEKKIGPQRHQELLKIVERLKENYL